MPAAHGTIHALLATWADSPDIPPCAKHSRWLAKRVKFERPPQTKPLQLYHKPTPTLGDPTLGDPDLGDPDLGARYLAALPGGAAFFPHGHRLAGCLTAQFIGYIRGKHWASVRGPSRDDARSCDVLPSCLPNGWQDQDMIEIHSV